MSDVKRYKLRGGMPDTAALFLPDEVVSAADYAALEAECAELDALRGRQSDLLSQTAIALRGPEPALTRYSHADIPSRVKLVVAERDTLRAELAALKAPAVAGDEREACSECNGLGFGPFGGCGECCGSGQARPAQTEQQPVEFAEGWRAGVEAMAKFIEKKADDYAMEHGHDDMGGLSFGTGQHAQIKADYHSSLIELAEEVRTLLAAPIAQTPADGLVEAAEVVMRAAKWWKENTDSPKSALIHFARASDAVGDALAAHRAGGAV